jgi:TRAP-type C4-dicarboxylate transport system permease large subunit
MVSKHVWVIGLIVLILTGLEFGGDYLFTVSKSFGFGVLVYALIGGLWGWFIQNRQKFDANLARANAAWQVGSIIFISLLSRYLLKEKLSTASIVGLIISGGGILLVGLGS